LNTDNCAGRSAILTLAVSDVVRIRGQVTTGTANYTTNAGGVSLQIMSIGSTGPAGPTGATGSGSNIIVQDDGSTVSGGPHSTLNFINATIADAGAGVVDISNIKQCLVCCPFGGDNANTGEFSTANGKASDQDLNSGPKTRQPIISGGTLIRLAYQTQQANSSSVMKVHINGSVQATVPLTNINANLGGVETISVSVSAGDYVELEYDTGQNPRDSTWCFLLEVS